jgi:CHAT domain-containing protein
LFGQVADKIADKRLIIVPDGKLQYFPLGALPFPGSENAQPIIVSNEIVYEPSAQTLSLISRQHAVEADTKKDLLIFSDPVFSEADSRFPVGAEKATAVAEGEIPQEQFRFVESLNSLSRLVSSKAERESITQIIGSSNTDSLDGFSANRENLLNAKTSGYKILHFASHAFVNEERPELSGIVLSRFSQDGQKLDEFFRLHDIYDLNLNADLVVLSACQTGIGKEIRGEGLMSLDNAFLQSGAKSVLSTSWKVDDRATAELMKSFYKKLFEGLTPSAALRLAQLEMLNSAEFKSPFYWAAFSLRGDYRTPISFSRDYTKFLFLLLIPAIVAIFFYAQSRKKNNS